MKHQKFTKNGLWLLYIIAVAIIKFYYHELWKDEWQSWYVARDKSIGEIFSFLYYEGHPALWYLYLKVFTVFDGFIETSILINIAHIFIVAAGSYFLFIKFKFPIWTTVLFALSYFLFFEYGVINRGYYFVILFCFWSVHLLTKDTYKPYTLGAVLFLLCQTEVYGVIMAMCLGLYILLSRDKSQNTFNDRPIIGLVLGVMVFIVSIFPRSEGHITKTGSKILTFSDKLGNAIQGNLTNTFLPGATLDTSAHGWSLMGLLLAVLTFVGIFFIFSKDKKVLMSMMVFLIGMIVFSTLFFVGGIRQWGMTFVFFIAMLRLHTPNFKNDLYRQAVIAIFGIMTFIHGIRATYADMTLPFTNAKAAGRFIAEKVPIKVPIVAINKFEATPVIGYANRPFYELPSGETFTYFRWVDKVYIPTQSELNLFTKYKGVGGIVLISPQKLDSERFPNAKLWQSFNQLNYKNENYYLYSVPSK